MKRRYLFPLLYIVADASALLFINIPPIPLLISKLSIPSSFVMRIILKITGIPTDLTYVEYFVVLGAILQIFLLGLGWELLVNGIQKLVNRNRVAA